MANVPQQAASVKPQSVAIDWAASMEFTAPKPKPAQSKTRPEQPQTQHREHCLVVVNGDGYVQCFGGKNLSAKIVFLPSPNEQFSEADGELLLESTLPKPYQEIYCPGYSRATYLATPQTWDDVNRIVETLDSLDKISKEPRYRDTKSRLSAVIAGGR